MRAPAAAARTSERGYAMAALLVGLSVMAVLMSMALPVWSQFARREREEELIWRGQQYARAVGLFQRKFANTFPPTIDILVEQRFLRKKYKDPITNDDFLPIPAGGVQPGQIDPRQPGQTNPQAGGPPASGRGAQNGLGGQAVPGAPVVQGPSGVGVAQPFIGIQGVVSKSKESSIKIYNGRSKYNEWAFVYLASSQRGGAMPPGGGLPGNGPGGNQQQGRGGFPNNGVDRRPGVNAPGQPNPFGQPPPFGQPSPFGQPPPIGQPSPFGPPGRPMQPPQRPPGN